MNCSDAQPILRQYANSALVEGGPDHVALRAHLATCPACQHALRSLSQWDVQLVRAMNDVVVPTGLSQRLAIAMNEASSIDLRSNPAVSKPGLRKTWTRTLISLAAVGLLSVAVWGTWRFSQPPLLSPTDVAALLQESVEALPVAKNSGQPLPQQWMSLRARLVCGDWKDLQLDIPKVKVAVIPFEVRSKRSPSVKGSLFAIPRSRWAPAAVNSAAQASIHYAPPHAWIVWSEKDAVYILALDGPSTLLEQLQRQLDDSHSVL